MAENPLLDEHGLPVPFVGEAMVLMRRGIELHAHGLPSLGDARWAAKGVLYLSSVRMVFVASSPHPTPAGTPLRAFDMPLLYISREKFNQPIFGCNNISGQVLPVHSAPGPGAPSSPPPAAPIQFVVYFMEGGVGTFLPLFGSLLRTLRAANPSVASQASAGSSSSSSSSSSDGGSSHVGSSPLPSAQPVQVLETMRSAFMDPKDPTVVYVEQPPAFSTGMRRRRNYQAAQVQE